MPGQPVVLLINTVILSVGGVMGVVEKDDGQYDTVIPVFWVTGAAPVYPTR